MASIANVVTVSGNRISIVPTAGAVVGSGNMTAANPIVVTIDAHGLDTGDYVSFSAIAQANWTALNNKSYQIKKLTANTFSIPVDGSGFGAYTDASGEAWHDFSSAKYFPRTKIPVAAIDFYGSNAADVLIVRLDSYTGAVLFKRKDVTPSGIERVESPKAARVRPYIRFSEATLNTPGSALVSIEFN